MKKIQKITHQEKNLKKRKCMFDQHGTLMNGINLTFEKGFGFNQNTHINSSATCIDDNKVIYLIDKQIITYDMLTQTQKLVDNVGQQEQITSFMYFKDAMYDSSIFYTYQIINKTYPTLIIHNLSKMSRQNFVMVHLEKQQTVEILILVNGTKSIGLLSQLQGNYRLSIINIQTKNILATESIYFKVMGMFVSQAYQNCIVLYNSNEIYLVEIIEDIQAHAVGFSKILKTGEKIVQAISSMYSQFFIYVITDKGFLYCLKIDALKKKIIHNYQQYLGNYMHPGQTVEKHKIPSAICCNQYNVLIGYQIVPQLTLFKVCAIPTDNYILETISFSCPNLHKIIRLSFAHQTMAVCITVQVKINDKYGISIPINSQYLNNKDNFQLCCTYNNNQPGGKIFPVVLNLLLYNTLVETLRSPIQSILSSLLFVSSIIDIAVIPTKKLMIILSAEGKIKAIKWDQLTSINFHKMLQWQSTFNANDQPTSLDAHSLTLQVAVAVKNGVKMFNICESGLKSMNLQFPMKHCQCVKYSKFGHKLLASSLNQILIINPYNHCILNIIQLNSNFNCSSLNFLDHDLFIFAQFQNGSNIVMSVDGTKLFEVWNKSQRCLCSGYDHNSDIMLVSYQESVTKFYREHGTQQFAVMWTYPFNITQLLIVQELGVVFMGTSFGTVRVYQWPFTDMIKFTKSFTEIHLHKSAVTKIILTHDFTLLITGSQDGSVFISKVNAYTDGMLINDSQMMHNFNSSCNYTNLYYLQKYQYTNSQIQFAYEENIVQLESDKADFELQYVEIINNLHNIIDEKIKIEENQKKQELKKVNQDQETIIEQLTQLKIKRQKQLKELLQQKQKTIDDSKQKKLEMMRKLYQESDQLKEKKQHYYQHYAEQVDKLKKQYKAQLQFIQTQYMHKYKQLNDQCQNFNLQCQQTVMNYKELMKEQAKQGEIYKIRMLQEMAKQLQQGKQEGESLRKNYNKLKHKNQQQQDKIKYIQQLILEMEIDIQGAAFKKSGLSSQLSYLQTLLKQKDKQIIEEQKNMKSLMKNNIDNYSHENYLKLKQDKLIERQKYLQNEIENLNQKYDVFEIDFIRVTTSANDLNRQISQAINNINTLKKKLGKHNIKLYQCKYIWKKKNQQVFQAFHLTKNVKNFSFEVGNILKQQVDINIANESKVEQTVQHRDYLIKLVVNVSNLRKIDDDIRKTIMVKLNRQTVTLTCQVNQLRKQKKLLIFKIKQLKNYIQNLTDQENFNKQNTQFHEFVPNNISVIKSIGLKDKLLPFQQYHKNKTASKHSKILEQSSTQLPSILKSSHNPIIENTQLELQDIINLKQ